MTRIQVGGRGYWYEEILRYDLNVPSYDITAPPSQTNVLAPPHVRLILNELEEVLFQGTLFKRHVVVDLPPGPISEAFRFFCEAFAKSNAILDLDERLSRKAEILAQMEFVQQENLKAAAKTAGPEVTGSVSRPLGPTLLKPYKPGGKVIPFPKKGDE